MSDETIDPTPAVETYMALWNESDPAARAAMVAKAWVDDGTFCDPLVDVAGHDGIAAGVTEIIDQFPGMAYRLASPVDRHHHTARWAWEALDGDGNVLLVGFDTATVVDDGRLRSVIGYFGALEVAS